MVQPAVLAGVHEELVAQLPVAHLPAGVFSCLHSVHVRAYVHMYVRVLGVVRRYGAKYQYY